MRPLLLWMLLVCVIFPGPARSADWAIDPVHSRVAVSVDHAGFSRSLAVMSVQEGQLVWDPAAPEAAQVDVILDLRRLDFGDPRWNQAVQGRQMLDVARHPTARFVSHRVTTQADGTLSIDGDLHFRGTRTAVNLTAQRNAQRRHPMPPFRQTVGFSATGTLSREALGVGTWAGMVGDAVALQIEIEATLSTRRPHAGNMPPTDGTTGSDDLDGAGSAHR